MPARFSRVPSLTHRGVWLAASLLALAGWRDAGTTSHEDARPVPSRKIHDVRMIGDGKTYRFEPSSLTIKVGDRVRWTMVSGGPHNVAFWPDSIPRGAEAVLTRAMAKPFAPLAGPLLAKANEKYTIAFDKAPKGTYRYYCTPHLALGMKATITVQ